MNKVYFLIFVGVGLLVYSIYGKKSIVAKAESNPSQAALNGATNSNSAPSEESAKPFTTQSNESPHAQVAAKISPEVSLKQMTTTLFEAITQEQSYDRLISSLQRERQDPILIKQSNSYTGELNIIRTKSPLPGTRYFHAQYFTDEKGERYAQNITFEYKPGPQAMDEAKRAVQSSFNSIGQPTLNRADFIKWELPSGYNVWIKKLTLEDLSDDPFNAYSPEDVGTIQVTVELDPHA